VPGARQKQEKTNLLKYGYKNAFSSDIIKEKILKTNVSRYGTTSYTKTKEYIEKAKSTCMSRYGETNPMKAKKYRDAFTGENSPVWKGGKDFSDARWERLTPNYIIWRNSVYQRDNYICQKCKTKKPYIEAHHIFNWNDNPDKRYDIQNGITLCRECNVEFHRQYGKKCNNFKQLKEYLIQR